MDTQTIAVVGGGAMCLSVVSILVATIYYSKGTKSPSSNDSSDTSGDSNNSTVGSSGPGKPMPIPEMKKGGPWNIFTINNPERISSDGKTVTIKYAPDKQGMDSGAAFKAAPPGLPATTATLSYSVFFPTGFDWNKGGKLGGMCIGKTQKSCATGGNWQIDAGSFRFMFREKGQAIGYAYFPLKGGNQGSYSVQGTEYKKVADASNGNTGHDVWYKKDKAFQLKLNTWNTMSMTVVLNTIGKNDGSVTATVNGVTRKITGMTWRTDPAVKISNVDFVSFYGGSTLEWKCNVGNSKCTYTQYKDLKFSAS